MSDILLGFNNNDEVKLSLSTLSTHCAILGSSGCGKTVALKVLIEELILNKVPVIAIDPHGDISSLIYNEENEDLLKSKGISENHIQKFKNEVDVNIWSPGSTKGIPLSVNPLQFDDLPEDLEDRIKYISYSAQTLASLLDYDQKKIKSIYSGLQIIIEYYLSKNINISNFTKLTEQLDNISDDLMKKIKLSGLSIKDIEELKQKLYRFTVGAESLLFNTGEALNIDTLLGRNDKSNKTRLSIIYLNALSTDSKREFFISILNQKIYNWMKKNQESVETNLLQCGYFIDEVAPWMPPVKKPLCKESFERLFKEARKFGVSLVVATQSPGDLDYKVIAQVSTTLLGKIQTSQEIEKVKAKIESKDNLDMKAIVKKLPNIKTGTFLMLSKEFSDVIKVSVRWLLTKHGIDSSGKNWLVTSKELKELMNEKKEIIEKDSNVVKELNKEIVSSNDQKELKNIDKISNSSKKTLKDNNYDDEIVWIAENKIFERDINKRVRKFLEGGMFFKDEDITESKFSYMRLIRVELSFMKKKGFIRKTTEEISGINLYLRRIKISSKNNEYKILSFDKGIRFDSIVDEDPDQILDLDDKCDLIQKTRSELRSEYEFRGRVELKNLKNDIIKVMEKKYDIEVKNLSWTLFPIWSCELTNKKNKSKRNLIIDGVFGKKIIS